MIRNIFNARNQNVGFVDGNTYISDRDWNKAQVFYNPKYKNAMGLDIFILKQLITLKVDTIRILVKNFEKRNFWVESSINNFLENSIKINFDKYMKGKNITKYSPQRIMAMEKWKRVIFGQKKLEVEE